MTEFAIYGKGGIGKSTISANISAALGRRGRRVLQIGCDPKHDSTRLLLHGERLVTVLDYLKETSPDKCRLSDIVRSGVFGIHCLEAGGPEPGVGCAGRGILTTFELIGRLGIKSNNYDAILYDVLGDVVCGGFAVPIRREYAEKVYIVTSGEFMALYAANNILRGLKNYDHNLPGRAGGIIFNSRALGEEDSRIRRFCDAVGLPLLETFPRSDLFSACEKEGKCLVEGYPDSDLAQKFDLLAEKIETQQELYAARPLSDEELEERILGRERKPSAAPLKTAVPETAPETAAPAAPALFSKSLVSKEPLMGCAFSGAMSIAIQIAGALCVAHGPRSCAHITYQSNTSKSRRFLLERGLVLAYTSAPPVFSSDMNEGVMIFGGIEELRNKIIELKEKYPAPPGEKRIFFVLTTCPAGIIGDNIGRVMDLEGSDAHIVPLKTDGNMQGDYLQGILFAHFEIARALIDRNIAPEENTVNIVAEKPETYALAESFDSVKEILDSFGIRVNCHFICETTVEDVRAFRRGKLNLLAWDDYMGRTIREFLEREYGAEFFDEPFPVGFRAACNYARRLGAYFKKGAKEIDAVIARFERRYREEVRALRPKLEGKRLMIITITQNIDWALEAAIDTGMIITFAGIMDYSQDNRFTTGFRDAIEELSLSYDLRNAGADVRRIKPDLLISPFPLGPDADAVLQDNLTYSPTAGFFSGLELARRWAEIFNMNLMEGWRKDEYLFRKHYA
ncbi:MAG: AAA family ATPase [Spirochaetaceae bacterium]|jgi:nitrogenase iron protein|nr:AAA family ATPase [Spirochaetaceae bacterium]